MIAIDIGTIINLLNSKFLWTMTLRHLVSCNRNFSPIPVLNNGACRSKGWLAGRTWRAT
jgi:hypothetical protein